jgi:hypothetical protein
MHPLLSLFGNIVPWTAGFISDQAEMLKKLSSIDGFDILLQKLRDSDGFREDISLMDAAYRFGTFSRVPSLHHTISGREKDILTELDGQECVIEVTNSNSPIETRERNTWEAIVIPLEMAWREITAQGTIHKPLSKNRAKEANEIVRNAIACARREGRPKHVSMERAFEFTIYPKEKFPDITYKLEGLPFAADEKRSAIEIDHLYDTIRKKSDQLVAENVGGVVVYSDPDYFIKKSETNGFAEKLVDDLEEALYDRDRLSFFVLILIDIGAGEEKMECEDFLYRERTKHRMLHERILVIRNKYAAKPMDISTLRPLIA